MRIPERRPCGCSCSQLSRTVRGRHKETLAEIPGLFPSATVIACFGGRDQQLTISSCSAPSAIDGADAAQKKVRDIFTEAMGQERIAPVPFVAPSVAGTYDEQIRAVAATMESSM